MNIPTVSASLQAVVQEELARFKAHLKWRENDIRLAAADAIMEGDDLKASELLPTIRDLVSLRNAIGPHFPIAINARPTPTLPRPAPAAGVACKVFGLRAFLAGAKIQGSTDACTFADAIQAIGCHAVADLKLTVNICPLASRERQLPSFGRYRRRMQVRQRAEGYVVTHCSTARKTELLREIGRRLKVDLVVEKSWTSTI